MNEDKLKTRPLEGEAQPAEKADPLIAGPDGAKMRISRRLVLGIEKFKSPSKYYLLIWMFDGEAWLCEERSERFKHKNGPDGIVEAGRALAKELGVRFSEVTR